MPFSRFESSFYPHAPGGARPALGSDLDDDALFLSARPGRGATSWRSRSSII